MPNNEVTNLVNVTYPINVYSYISSLDRLAKRYPNRTNFSFSTTFQGEEDAEKNLFLTKYMPNNEIPRNFYRSGILSTSALESEVKSGKLYVKPGEFQIEGTDMALNYDTFATSATTLASSNSLSLLYAESARLALIKTGIYREESLWMSPKENSTIEGAEENYLGYAITAGITEDSPTLLVNNYILNQENTEIPIYRKRFNEEDYEINSDNLAYFAELLGEIAPDNNTFPSFVTLYSPITEVSSDPGSFSDNKTHIAIDYGNNTIDHYYCANSYIEAELLALEKAYQNIIDETETSIYSPSLKYNYCYLNRFKGEVIFKEEIITGSGFIPAIIPAEYCNANVFLVGSSHFVLTLDINSVKRFGDIGLVKIQSGLVSEIFRFNKIDSKRIQFHRLYFDTYEGEELFTKVPLGNSISITPFSVLNYPSSESSLKIYAIYDALIEFQQEIPNSPRKPLSSDLKPWLWKKQRTIAVLSKSEKLYPYKITLRPIDIEYMSKLNNVYTYGPIYNGAELILLEGEVLTKNNQPIPEQEVLVEILIGPGFVEGGRSINVTTNDEGKFYLTYNPNGSRFNWLYFFDEDINRDGNTTTLTVNPANNNSSYEYISSGLHNSIIYAILKDDPSQGSVGQILDTGSLQYILRVENTPLEDKWQKILAINTLNGRLKTEGAHFGFYIFNFLKEDEILKYINGSVILNEDQEYRIKNITLYPEAWFDGDTENFDYPSDESMYGLHTYFVAIEDTSLSGNALDTNLIIEKAQFFGMNDLKYAKKDLNGRRVIISEEKSQEEWVHPSVNNYSSSKPIFGPVMTVSYDETEKKFLVDARLPISDSMDITQNVAGYCLNPETFAVLQASTLGRNNIKIYSNKVKFYIILNEKDKGVVKTILNKYVPYGFRLEDDRIKSSSTMDVETFLTVNTTSGISFNPRFPVISYIDSNGIIYSDIVYKSITSSLDLVIKSTD